ncbi:MAG TPA: hypothetical protein VHO69_13685 [Phototrophicaceae bacterium]|nr:hypothetical protein [Phototrophicaceae bacterium]
MDTSAVGKDVERTQVDIKVIQLPAKYLTGELDRRLPQWARRTNPIIRRQLGLYWKTIMPELDTLAKVVLVQIVLVALSLPWPWLFDLALPTITAALLLFPIAVYLYAQMLVAIGVRATLSMADELRKGTFDLVRTTPLPLTTILASKIAAAIWRQLENLSLLMTAVAVMSMPLLISQYASLFPLDTYPVLARVSMALGLVVSLLRLALEPFMVGALALAAGTVFPARSTAIITTLFLGGFYFFLLNLVRLVPSSWPVHFVVEFILPLLLPLVIIGVALKITTHLITRN